MIVPSQSRLFKPNQEVPFKSTETMKQDILETYLHLKKQMKRPDAATCLKSHPHGLTKSSSIQSMKKFGQDF